MAATTYDDQPLAILVSIASLLVQAGCPCSFIVEN